MRPSIVTQSVQFTGALLSLCLVVTGCSMLSGGSKLHKSAKGSVYLEEVADWSFDASHPAVIDHMTMLKVVKGVMADDGMSASAKMPASGSKPMRVFSDEDAEFLAPLLAQSLSQAKPEQIVGFTVSPSAGSGAEPTAGTLYVQQGAIHLTIAPSRSKKVSGFVPNAAVRMEKAPSYAAAGGSGAMTMVIDSQMLAKAPMPAAMPMPVAAAPKPVQASPAPVAAPVVSNVPAAPIAKTAPKQEPPVTVQAAAVSNSVSNDSKSLELSNDELLSKKLDELRQVREANKMKESEIAILKREVEWMKQELRERTAEVKAIKASKTSARPAPKKKSAEAFPTR